jgi:YHS domain-containing protein
MNSRLYFWVAVPMMVALVSAVSLEGREKNIWEPRQEYSVNVGKGRDRLYIESEGKVMYFQCDVCPEDFLENPDTYVEKMIKESIKRSTEADRGLKD